MSRRRLVKNRDAEVNKDPSNRRTLHTDVILLHTPPTAGSEESLGRFLHKNRRFLNGRLPLSFWAEHTFKAARLSTSRHARTWWHHITVSPFRTGAREGAPSWAPHHPKSSTRAPIPGLTLRKKSLRARTTSMEWGLLGMCNDDGIRIHHRCCQSKISLQPYPPPKEDMFKQIKSELKHNLSPLEARLCHKNQSYELRSSRRSK